MSGKTPRTVASRWGIWGATVMLAASVLTGCGQQDDKASPVEDSGPQSTDFFGYQVNSGLATTNAATAYGAANQAPLLSGRLYTSVYVPGPSGQMIPNTDLVEAQELDGKTRKIIYTLSEEARYSDGAPVTCDDFLLAYKAGQHPDVFGSHIPLMDQVESLKCASGNKKFSVTFKKDMGQRWRHLFGPGTVMPSHAIAKKIGLEQKELVGGLYREDQDVMTKVAKTWRYGFNLDKFDKDLQVSYGPFAIERIGEDGEVILVRNENYYGDKPKLDRLVVWPKEADSAMINAADGLQISDAPQRRPDWLDRNAPGNPFDVDAQVGELTDTLVISDAGLLAQPWARQAFNACVDHKAIASASSKVSGVKVPPVYLHVVRHSDPMRYQLGSAVKDQKQKDIGLAHGLSGTEIKVGYAGSDKRKAAMVKALSRSCEEAGITIVDKSSPTSSQLDLKPQGDGMPKVDVFLGEVDPLTEYGSISAPEFNAQELAKEEKRMWEELKTIPLAAEPRIFIIDREVENVVPYTGISGIGWNMDRWVYTLNGSVGDDSDKNSGQ